MCAFRMWWPSSMVCWRFSLLSCRENMNASRACPFLGQEIQRLMTKDPIPAYHRPSAEDITLPLSCHLGASAWVHRTLRLPALYNDGKWYLFCSHLQGLSWGFLSLQSEQLSAWISRTTLPAHHHHPPSPGVLFKPVIKTQTSRHQGSWLSHSYNHDA